MSSFDNPAQRALPPVPPKLHQQTLHTKSLAFVGVPEPAPQCNLQSGAAPARSRSHYSRPKYGSDSDLYVADFVKSQTEGLKFREIS